VWSGGNADEAELLASAYRWSIRLAEEVGVLSIAFPAISTGTYGYPLVEATRVAVAAVGAALREGSIIERVIFACFSEDALVAYERVGVAR
jgi:O-acetyl-ADP-ribose deacetylase (regulator of RNase III)